MKNPVIFLDFDGVIRVQIKDGAWAMDSCDFCPTRMQALAKICETTGAKIVVSSDWRNLENRPEIEKLIGKLAMYLHDDWATPICGHRWNECARWLGRHPEVTGYAILEDFEQHFEGCPPSMRLRLILCNNRHGFVPALYPALLDLLKSDILQVH